MWESLAYTVTYPCVCACTNAFACAYLSIYLAAVSDYIPSVFHCVGNRNETCLHDNVVEKHNMHDYSDAWPQ